MWVISIKFYSGILFKWECFIQMRMVYFAPILSLLPLLFGRRKEAFPTQNWILVPFLGWPDRGCRDMVRDPLRNFSFSSGNFVLLGLQRNKMQQLWRKIRLTINHCCKSTLATNALHIFSRRTILLDNNVNEKKINMTYVTKKLFKEI